ncbi:chromosomal replication initiator protein DnaA [Candidatus Shapirobacteria bacterium]|nr:chromosomal replication initiator protein DnaA [Candidatus Shapirobacteria bacterium]
MNQNALWENIQEELKIAVSKTNYQALLSQTQLLSLENNVATIGCPSAYLQELVESRYYSLIKEILDRQTGEKNSLVFTISQRPKKTPVKIGPLFEKKERKESFNPKTGLLPYYNFSSFVVGSSNNFAHAAAQAIVENPGQAYNPFFVWGGVGVGKTHLIQAIGNAIAEKHPNLNILYATAETFTNELVAALQSKTITSFKRKYRQVDVLLIDDIQFIAGKEYSQEEFFHTFNYLYLAGRQVVLTSDRRPEEIQPLENRLTSRFMGGLTVDIQPPDYEMRLAILKQKAREKGFAVHEEVLSFLAQTIESNARELEGALLQLKTRALAENTPLTLDFASKFYGRPQKNLIKITPRKVLSQTAKEFSFKIRDLCGKSRKAELVNARHIAMYLLRKDLNLPLMKIGELLGNRDHSTVIHAIEKINQEFTTNETIRHHVVEIRKEIGANN